MNRNLSIIIPHYNSPSILNRLLSSIGKHDDIEVIVVDDNSTKLVDEYEACKQAFTCSNIRFYTNNSGIKGAGASRNIGLKHATGKWLLFADADDWFLSSMYDVVKKHFGAKTDLVFFPVSNGETVKLPVSYRIDARRYNSKCYSFYQGIDKVEHLLRYTSPTPWSKLIKKDLVEKHDIRFDEVMYSNDVMFSLKCGFYAGEITVDYTPIYVVTDDNCILTKTLSADSFYIRCAVLCERYNFMVNNIPYEKRKYAMGTSPAKSLAIVIKRKYGIKQFIRFYKLFRSYQMPIFPVQQIVNTHIAIKTISAYR